jgi:hypothetical protein
MTGAPSLAGERARARGLTALPAECFEDCCCPEEGRENEYPDRGERDHEHLHPVKTIGQGLRAPLHA